VQGTAFRTKPRHGKKEEEKTKHTIHDIKRCIINSHKQQKHELNSPISSKVIMLLPLSTFKRL
jgi:hypothetical protein